VLEKRGNPRVPKSIARAAASPGAIVLAGAGVAIGVAAHLGIAVAVVLGAVGYSARVGWAALGRRRARKRGLRHAAIDPWSVPEPWRGYARRALDARKRFADLAKDCPAGVVAERLAIMVTSTDETVEQLWGLVRAGAVLAGPPGRAEKAAQDLQAVQAALLHAGGSSGHGRADLESRESALASELRSARRLEAVAGQVSGRLDALCSQLEGLVATEGELVLGAAGVGADLGSLSMQLSALNEALGEAMRSIPPAESAPNAGQP